MNKILNQKHQINYFIPRIQNYQTKTKCCRKLMKITRKKQIKFLNKSLKQKNTLNHNKNNLQISNQITYIKNKNLF